MQINKIHNIDFLKNTLPDKCAQLIIADPPYFEVKGSFDFIWKSFEDYLIDVEKWAIECKRLLADNGTLFWYGHAKKIAYTQIILDKYFNIINNITWEKSNCQTIRNIENLRSFAPVTERLLMYSNEINYTDIQDINNDFCNFKEIRDYLWGERLKIKNISFNEISKKALGYNYTHTASGMASNIISPFKKGWTFPQEKDYVKLQKTYNICNKPYVELKNEYENQKKEYEEKRRYFDNYLKLTDVIRFGQEDNISRNYDHDTCKPQHMSRSLILTCSRPNDLVLVPFSGSGTECAMAAKENRNFIGFDIENKYVEMGNKRCVEHLRTQSLFS